MGKSDSEKGAAQATAARADADVDFIEALARILRENDLAELDVTREYGEDDELQVRLSRYGAGLATAPVPAAPPTPVAAAPVAAAPAAAIEAPVGEVDASNDARAVTSPMVGTVYLQPSPDADNFVKVGAKVSEGDTLVIVEAMKVMNAIPSPRDGVVKKILVENEQPVEYGAPLMIIE